MKSASLILSNSTIPVGRNYKVLRPRLLLQKSARRSQEGFTILEVFVALIVSLSSLAVALQLFMTATYLRVRATQYGDVKNWVQDDFERIKAQADAFEQDVFPHSSYCGSLPSNNLAASFIADTTEGLGGASETLGPRDFSTGSFTLTRTASYASNGAPDRLVSLNYVLTPTTGGKALFEIDAEVAIYAAFRCPT